MDIANYVNNIGKQINRALKGNINLDRISIINLTLIHHLTYIYNRLKNEIISGESKFTQKDLDKIEQYILNLKKEINFYEISENPEELILIIGGYFADTDFVDGIRGGGNADTLFEDEIINGNNASMTE